jgi:hypothetical protein
MRTRNPVLSCAIVLSGLFSLAGSDASARGVFDCPISVCVSICPEEPEQFCQSYGCTTTQTGACLPLGSCQHPQGGIQYCGTPM